MMLPRCNRSCSGFTLWEVTLFLVFLGIAGGASMFFFFVGSTDMKLAKARYVWTRDVHALLDRISLEIAFAMEVDHPFAGESRECRFRQSYGGYGDLRPSLVTEGFGFVEDTLVRVVRDASGTSRLRSGGSWNNPLLRDVKTGVFRRRGPHELRMLVSLTPPGSNGETVTFERTICLRNQ